MRYPGTIGVRHSPNVALLDQSVTDPYFSSVVLLALNESGADGGTTFTDQSGTPKTLTANGNAQWDTAQAPTGLTSSGLFDGTGDFISTPDSADWDFGTGDFAIECWAKINAVGGGTYSAIVAPHDGTGDWGVYYRNSDRRLVFYDGTNILLATVTVPTASFGHAVVSRTSGNLEMWVDGSRGYNLANTTNITNNAALRIGSDNNSGVNNQFNGWIAAVRITKGSNRGYTGATISVPTLPLPTS